MLIIFGITAFLIFLYFMYPVWLTLLSPGHAGDRSETKMGNGVTLILLSYNGQQYLEDKINFLLKELSVFHHYELIIVDDNSQDGSKEILDNFRNTQNIKIITKSEHKGIPHTMNLAVEHAKYEYIIFCDQRQDLSGNILQRLVEPLNYSNIGAVSACISDVDKQNCCSRLRKFENFIKSKESRTGNLVGVYGPLYAIKKECYSPIPEHIILDDLYLSLKILGSKQIRILEDCRIFDDDPTVLYNYKRITRYLHGFLQLIREKSLLGRLNGKQLIMLLWHKYLRLMIPFLLFLSYLCAGLLISRGTEYLVLFVVITAIGIISLLPVRIHSGLRSLIRMNILYLIGLTDFFMKTGWIILASIVVISLAMHFRHFEKDLMGLHVWRQTQTQSNIVSFCEEDMNIFNPRRNDRGDGDGISRLEFPLMQWLVAANCKIFGNHLIITRIWMFIIGILSVLGIYKLLQVLFNKEILALMGAWAFNFSPSFYYYTINPLPDNLALCCSIWGLAIFFLYQKKGGVYKLAFSGLLLSAGALTKLPFILYFAVPLVSFLLEGWKAHGWKPSVSKATIVSIFLILPLAWYVSVIPQWYGNGIVGGMLENKASVSVLMGNFTHHLFITLPDLLLNYGSVLFFLAGFYFIFKNKAYKNPLFRVFAVWGLFLALYFLFELNMIGKSHDYYLFPFIPALFILVAYGAYHLFNKKSRFMRVFVITLLLILPATAYLRIDDRWNPEKPGFNRDLLTYKEELRQAVPKDALCIAGNDKSHFIFFYYIDKKGWAFESNELSGEQISEMISKGAKYLYSDSREIDSHPEIVPYLEELILEKGSVRVFRLKVHLSI